MLGSYTAVPVESGTLDAVLSLGTALGYLGDRGDRMALREFRRVLAPGGRIVIETLHSAAIGEKLREREERPLVGGGTLRFERRFEQARRVMREEQRFEDGTAADQPRAYDLRVYSEREALPHARARWVRGCRTPRFACRRWGAVARHAACARS